MDIEKFRIYDHRPLRELVFEQLRGAILNGTLKPGERLMEMDLAEKLGVSRTPIREAIRKLELEGLVVMEARKGAYVADVSVKETVEILEVRSVLEGLAASLAAKRITEEELERLYKISQDFNEAVKVNDMKKMIENDTRFHNLIFEATRNKKLIQIVNSLQELVIRFRTTYFSEYKRGKEMPAEHNLIYKALKNGDAVTAQKHAEHHVDMLKEVILYEEANNLL
ncbi:MAG: GntR family transcriptional regulator [Clostridiales bacterium]|nr:GntR family transcriptional regulator [Clostridiales bacterium]